MFGHTFFSHGAETEFQPAFHICPVYHRSSSCLFAITVALPEAGNERKTWPYFVRSLFTHTLWESPVPNSIGSILPTAEDLKYSEKNVLFCRSILYHGFPTLALLDLLNSIGRAGKEEPDHISLTEILFSSVGTGKDSNHNS